MITYCRDYLGNKGERNGKNQKDRIHFLASGTTTRWSSSLEVCRMVEFVTAVNSRRRSHERNPMVPLPFRRVIIHSIVMISIWREWPINVLPFLVMETNGLVMRTLLRFNQLWKVNILGKCDTWNRLKNLHQCNHEWTYLHTLLVLSSNSLSPAD